MNKPLVSIIMPVYNMGEKLEVSIPNVLNQTYENIELILVDDGSKDNSLDIVNEFAKKDRRIRVYHQDNKGSGPARNLGIKNAEGKYVYFPDADDYMDKNAIEFLVDVLTREKCDMVVFGYKSIAKDGKEVIFNDYPNKTFAGEYIRTHYDIFSGIYRKWNIQGAPWNKIFDLDIVKNNNIEFPDLRRNQDEVFIMRYVNYTEKVTLVNNVLYGYYRNDIKRAFDKFPLEYFEIVSRLNKYRVEYIYEWNRENKTLLNSICMEFIYATNKSLMLLFNPKWNLSFKERYDRIKDIARRCVNEMPDKTFKTNSALYILMKKELYMPLYFASFLALLKNRKNIR